jgi:catechol 2,3-dioxygenase-like lactoylglutathione lyase family enzyme
MPRLLLNIDVPDIAAAEAFYTDVLGLRVGRRFDDDLVELVGAETSIFLLERRPGTSIGPAGGDERRYERHWTPVHADFGVDDLDAAISRATAAGAVQEGETLSFPYGRQAMFADPFGHGFCLIEFTSEGYDAFLP